MPRGRLTTSQLIEKHRALDRIINVRRDHFLSDWNGGHPLLKRFLGPELLNIQSDASSCSRYIFFDEEHSVIEAIQRLHLIREALQLSPENILAGPGSSSFLTAMSHWLRQQGYAEVHYLPPLYYTFHFFLEALNIIPIAASKKHVFETGATLDLPPRQTVLILSDPVWFAGRRVPLEKINEIAEWQKLTKSLVLIDGSFQYMQWDGSRQEYTSLLDPELTFRLICPTKSLGVPFFRFAYLLHPSWAHDDFVFIYESVVGGATASDRAFAHRALEILSSDESKHALTEFFQATYARLIESDLIRTRVVPECGYLVFAIPMVQLPGQIVMDQEYFELTGYPDHVRINLMAAQQIYFEKRPQT
ncbi:MAG: hypothetical protein M3441_21195 [Chloroflexota bacterium]|nr:hypothetical protein [Chloroflexota bacterium]